jgi:hypothetical protein
MHRDLCAAVAATEVVVKSGELVRSGAAITTLALAD